jgi:hypothetical protein
MMMMPNQCFTNHRPMRLGEAALRLAGCPFRLHGRDPATGLDCVGVVFASLAAIGRSPVAPVGYRLRNLTIDHWLDLAERSELELSPGPVGADEVLLMTLGYGQHHLMITTWPNKVIHAHAGLRRVVCHRRDPANCISAKWRIAHPKEG